MRVAAVLLAGLALTASAHAAPPLVTATATPAGGMAPLRVRLSAAGDAATYTWSLGDGATAEGAVRIPMWIAPSLFDTHAHGTIVVVHL